MAILRITVRVRPGASRTHVGGTYGDGQLVVAVNAPPVDGAANESVQKAVAEAFSLRPRDVVLVSGHQGRTKILGLEVPDADIARERLAALLSG